MRIYVDTPVFGGCFDPEFELWSTRLMHLFHIGKYTTVVSDISQFEIGFARNHIRQVLSEIPLANLKYGYKILEIRNPRDLTEES